MLPNKETKCHRTAFQETCFRCVIEHGCRLWKRVSEIVDRDPETGEAIAKDKFDCLDSITELFYKDMLRRQLGTQATIDEFRKDVQTANDGMMVGTLARLNQKIDAEADMRAIESSIPPKLLEGQ